MNNVRQLRLKKGIQQKELAIEIGVTNGTVSDWEHGRKNPSGERLRKLSEYFGVEPLVVLGQLPDPAKLFVPEDPAVSGKSETEQILERLLKQLDNQPKTAEARIVSGGMDKLPKEQREKLLNVFCALYPELIEGGDRNDPRP